MMKIVSDHGWSVASTGDDGNGLDAFKNERDYMASVGGKFKTTVAAMDWALREIERLRTARGTMMDWQPIKTAPKDGSRVLLFEPDGLGRVVAGWGWPTDRPEDGAWEVINEICVASPTHWMPLPEPPEGR